MAEIKLENVTKRFGDGYEAVRDVERQIVERDDLVGESLRDVVEHDLGHG